MFDFRGYDAVDFLLFDAETYARLFELVNRAVWPWQIMAVIGAAALLICITSPTRNRTRIALLLLAAAWAASGYVFIWQHYTTINWAAAYVAPLFTVQSGLLLAIAFAQPTDTGCTDTGCTETAAPPAIRSAGRAFALAVLIAALFGYPLLAPLAGRPLAGAQLFAVAPDPTAAATLAALAALPIRRAWILWPIPVVWCTLTGATLWLLQDPAALTAPILAATALLARILRGRMRSAMA